MEEHKLKNTFLYFGRMGNISLLQNRFVLNDSSKEISNSKQKILEMVVIKQSINELQLVKYRIFFATILHRFLKTQCSFKIQFPTSCILDSVIPILTSVYITHLNITSSQKKHHKVTKWCNALLAFSFQHKARHKYSLIDCKEFQLTVRNPKSRSLLLKKFVVCGHSVLVSKNMKISIKFSLQLGHCKVYSLDKPDRCLIKLEAMLQPFPQSLTEHCHSLPREAVDNMSWETVKIQLGRLLGNLL